MGPLRSTAGRLLVASPLLDDPNFARSVVLMISHDDDGALGVVLDRPSALAVDEVLEPWASRAATPPVFFLGGPVAPESAIGIGRVHVDGAVRTVVGNAAVIDLEADPAVDGLAISSIRVFAGYAGWGSGQLEGELGVGGWIVVGARADDVFDPEPATLWRRVLRRQRGTTAWLASFPVDLAAN